MRDDAEPRRRKLFAIVIGAAVAALLCVATAALGGLILLRTGAGHRIVTSFDGGITVDWGTPEYDDAAGEFLLRSVRLTAADPGVRLPQGQSLDLVLTDSEQHVLGRTSIKVGDAVTTTVPLDPGVSVHDLGRVVVALQAEED